MNSNAMMQEQAPGPYLTIREFARRYHETWTEASIRWLIYNNTGDFNNKVVRRIGKTKILLSVSEFWKWVENQNQDGVKQ
jgi:hypothetical protein